ncbi:glycosyltransferase [Sutcliffiella horikoshii]|uniref:4,4'-diaponeurosporenoate glycosyltransferase n=1 Tax=Sutcliffiella horikoshii TaxID=79883 RepID=A0AA95B943_9BACI|nr:glycosyltransferase family 2 protein [Sutcliffiella horikoshii]TYS61371.1 glycosyltransferase [Sutcliffiella horikoshii]
MLYLAIFTFLFWFAVWLDAKIGMSKITKIEDVQENTSLHSRGRLLSVIVAAKDEEKHIEASLVSQFQQTYANIEWIIVNDRSTDGTGTIINRMAKTEPRMKCIHIEHLSEGWLGKNNALYEGYLQSKGEYILFTDADIIFKKDTILKAMTYFQNQKLDHLTLAPNLKGSSFWTNAFVSFFLFGFGYFKRPWKSNDPKSKSAIGIGAFNLLTRNAYEEIGTHRNIKMRPDDDLMLGRQIKEAGKKQHLALALTHLEVEWYPDLRSALVGLEKNTFAGLFYSYFMVLFAISGLFLSQLFPFIALIVTTGTTQLIFLLSILMLFLAYNQTANKMAKGANIYLTVFPITVLLFIYSIARATILTLYRGGIIWRGTFYSIKQLKK